MEVRVVLMNARGMMRRQYHLENIILLEFFFITFVTITGRSDGWKWYSSICMCYMGKQTPSPKIERLQVYMMDYDYVS